ncbi:hypothetical protein KAU45_08240 [bacterium]|nr:hypothetical protein [bacterium]
MFWGLGWILWGLIAVPMWIAPMVVGAMIGNSKGIVVKGVLLGCFLSWLGVLIVVILEGRGYEPAPGAGPRSRGENR